MRHLMNRVLAPTVALALTTGAASAEIIYQDDFSGSAANLHGFAPDIRPGTETWAASPIYNSNGSVDNVSIAAGSMTLAFTPADGLVYTLDASISGITGFSNNWFGMGFANGQSATSSANTRFITHTVVGTAWMLFRGNATANPNSTFLGTGELHPAVNGGLTNAADWLALTNDGGGDIDMRVVLDTTGGSGNWTATWYAKRTADASYSVLRASTPIPTSTEANFTSVGIAISNPRSSDGIDGTIESFSLTSVPEPGSLALMGFGGLLIARRRRSA